MGITIDMRESMVQANDMANRSIVELNLSRSVRYMLHTSTVNAAWTADKILRNAAYPLAQVSFPANRDLFRLEVGDLFKFTYEQYSIDPLICRVTQIRESNIESEDIQVEAIEDLNYVASNVITQPMPGLAETEDWDLIPLSNIEIQEAPFASAGDNIRIVPLAAREQDTDLGYSLYMSIDGGTSYTFLDNIPVFNPYGTLVDTYSADTYQIDDQVGFQVDFSNDDVDLIESTTRTALFGGTNTAILGNEIVTFQTITPISGSIYQIDNVYRGRFDTERETHAPGTAFWFLGLSNYRLVESTDLLLGTTRHFKMVPYNNVQAGSIALASVDSLFIEGRGKSPYIPTGLEANGENYAPTYTGDILLDWAPRVRGEWAGMASADVQTDAMPTWEGLFEVEVTVSGVVVRTETAIDDDDWTYTSAMNITDNGSLVDEVTFRVSNYITTAGLTYDSDQRSITVNKA